MFVARQGNQRFHLFTVNEVVGHDLGKIFPIKRHNPLIGLHAFGTIRRIQNQGTLTATIGVHQGLQGGILIQLRFRVTQRNGDAIGELGAHFHNEKLHGTVTRNLHHDSAIKLERSGGKQGRGGHFARQAAHRDRQMLMSHSFVKRVIKRDGFRTSGGMSK